MSDETREAVCTWCDHSAQGTALHNDEGRYDSCGAPDHGLAGTFVRTVHDPPVEEIHDDRCRRQYANQIGVDTCDCWKRLPAPQAEGDVREQLADVIGTSNLVPFYASSQVARSLSLELADAVLSSGLVVPAGEVERGQAQTLRNMSDEISDFITTLLEFKRDDYEEGAYDAACAVMTIVDQRATSIETVGAGDGE